MSVNQCTPEGSLPITINAEKAAKPTVVCLGPIAIVVKKQH